MILFWTRSGPQRLRAQDPGQGQETMDETGEGLIAAAGCLDYYRWRKQCPRDGYDEVRTLATYLSGNGNIPFRNALAYTWFILSHITELYTRCL